MKKTTLLGALKVSAKVKNEAEKLKDWNTDELESLSRWLAEYLKGERFEEELNHDATWNPEF